MYLRRIAVNVGWRAINVEGTRVRAKLTRQHGQYYAVGKDIKGREHAGVGSSVNDACNNLKRALTTVKHHHERQQ
jgi:hypothetical protein